MLNRRRFALNAALTVLGLTPLVATGLARAEEPGALPDTYRASPHARGGRGRPPRRRTSAAAGAATPGPRANPHEQLELPAGTVLTAAR